MVASSEAVSPQLDEIAHIGLAVEASLRIGVPRLAAAKAARMQTVARDPA